MTRSIPDSVRSNGLQAGKGSVRLSMWAKLRQVLSAGNWHMPRQAGDEEGITTKTSLRGGRIVGASTQGGDC
ncbi:hypothetical protein BCEP4_850028 [Burkholderia cepacia]|nr:hypothetical protein BCEP4_850028 [Burkholderia cepacia]